MTDIWDRWTRALASIVALIVLLVALPAALLAAAEQRFGARNPLARVEPPWNWSIDTIVGTLTQRLSDATIVDLLIRACLVTIWIAILVIVLSIAIEVAHLLRHGLPSPRIRGFGWAQGFSRWVAAGLISAVPLVSMVSTAAPVSASSPAATSQRWFPVGVAQPAHVMPGDATAPGTHDPASSTAATHLVQRGESVYGIAAGLSRGDDTTTIEIADLILDLNLGVVMNDGQPFSNPALIQPGWRLTLPDGFGQLDTPARNVGQHEVVAGDTLFEIAAEKLGDGDSWPQLWEANRGADMGDGRTFEDPDFLLAGWHLEIPASDAAQPDHDAGHDSPGSENGLPEPRATTLDPESLDPAAPTTRAHVPEALEDDGLAPSAPPTTTSPTTTSPTRPSTTTTSTTTVVAEVAHDSGQRGVVPNDPAPAPSPIRLEHVALFAAGMLTLVGVRRRRALRAALPHSRVPTPPPDIAATERRLRAVDPGERSARLDVAVRAAAHYVADTGVQIGSLRLAKDGEVVVRFTGDAELPVPWLGPKGGVGGRWTLPASIPIELLSADARLVGRPCLALVTIGVDADGRDVLVDLEACGTLVVDAQPDHADDVVRAIGSGLATSLDSEVAHLVVARLGTECLFDHPNSRLAANVEAAVAEALALAGSTVANHATSFDLRTRRTGGEMWEPAILLFSIDDDAAWHPALRNLPSPGHGIATVIAQDVAAPSQNALATAARVTAGSGTWVLDAFGERIEVTPVGLTNDEIEELAVVLADAGHPIEICPTQVEEDRPHGDFEPLPHELIVTLMGAIDVTDRHGKSGSFERSKTVELIAWLATHRNRATRTGARTALWELDVRDATFANVVSEARRAMARLVPPAEGLEWLARTLNESLPLHPLVVTDEDLIRERVEHARSAAPAHAIEVLRPAVEMIRDLPFAGTSYLWPDADGITSNLVLLATTASAELAEHALSMGDTDLVFWATGQGLKVLPGHEALIGLRMRAHARSGDLAGVRQEWESYERVVNTDPWSDGEPAPKLLELRRQLLSPTQ